jgi:hypothetical protein
MYYQFNTIMSATNRYYLQPHFLKYFTFIESKFVSMLHYPSNIHLYKNNIGFYNNSNNFKDMLHNFLFFCQSSALDECMLHNKFDMSHLKAQINSNKLSKDIHQYITCTRLGNYSIFCLHVNK